MFRLVFEENFVIGFEGVLSAHTGSYINLVFRRNVFVGAGIVAAVAPNESFVNNTFYRASYASTPVAAASAHPILLSNGADLGFGGGTVKNNIFVACGLGAMPANGWYRNTGVSGFVADYNFVAGDAPGFASKAGFSESWPDLNGGDPGFVDITDPLGQDGLPFTEDDGLRLRPDSKLRGQGENGMDLGAYSMPILRLTTQTNGWLRLRWLPSTGPEMLQWSTSVDRAWSNVPTAPTMEDEFTVLTVQATNSATFFRLAQ
jgi:hypothetical protein